MAAFRYNFHTVHVFSASSDVGGCLLIRNAIMVDVPDIHRLITHHAELNRMLFRSHGDLYEHLRDFFVHVDDTTKAVNLFHH